MKRLALIWTLFLIPIFLGAQFSIDTIGLKAYRLDIYTGYMGEEQFIAEGHQIKNSDLLFYIEGSKVVTDMWKKGSDNISQFKAFYFKDTPDYFSNYACGYPGYGVDAWDKGFFNCEFIVIYDSSSDSYQVNINYSNMIFSYECKLTEERPWDNEPINYVKEGQNYINDPQYTDEEVEEFFDSISDGKGKAIMKGIVSKFITDSKEEF